MNGNPEGMAAAINGARMPLKFLLYEALCLMSHMVRQSEGPPSGRPRRSHDQMTTDNVSHHYDAVAGMKRRREASSRMEPMACGCRDDWTCRCHDTPSDWGSDDRWGEGYIEGYVAGATDALRRVWVFIPQPDRAYVEALAHEYRDRAA